MIWLLRDHNFINLLEAGKRGASDFCFPARLQLERHFLRYSLRDILAYTTQTHFVRVKISSNFPLKQTVFVIFLTKSKPSTQFFHFIILKFLRQILTYVKIRKMYGALACCLWSQHINIDLSNIPITVVNHVIQREKYSFCNYCISK